MKKSQRSFSAGELDPALRERSDLEQFSAGLALCENFIVRPQGGVYNRPGMRYVGQLADSTKKARLIPFQFNVEQTYILEFTNLQVRVIADGAYLPVSAVDPTIFTLTTVYTEEEIFEIQYTQTADTMTIVHHDHPPAELTRTGTYTFTLSGIVFQAAASRIPAAPTLLAVGTGQGTEQKTYTYVITSTDLNGVESLASPEASITTLESSNTAAVQITWPVVAGTEYYTVYRDTGQGNQVYGAVGYAKTELFNDFNLNPNVSQTPPTNNVPFVDPVVNYPGVVGLYQQRRLFANTPTQPQTFFASQTGVGNSLRSSTPLRDTDAITFTIAGRQVNEIRHIIDLESLVIMTSGAIYPVSEGSDFVLTPYTVSARAKTYVGASIVRPVVTIDSVIYVTEKGNRLRDMINNKEVPGDGGTDLTIAAFHLFTGRSVVEMVYAHEPYGIVWCVMDDGKLNAMTYNKQAGMWAWHRHVTDGFCESIAVITEDRRDAIYLLVRRTINGVEKRYVERMEVREEVIPEDAFFVDSGVTYTGVAANVISGLEHLEGRELAVLADGNVVKNMIVTGGSITLPRAATKVQLGLGYESTLGTLGVNIGDTRDYGTVKNVAQLHVSMFQSRGGFVGPSVDQLVEIKPRFDSDGYDTIHPKTYKTTINIRPDWNSNGETIFQQKDPLPCAILSITPDFDMSEEQ